MNRKPAVRGRDGAMQRGWFARDTTGAGWTTVAKEETHGQRRNQGEARPLQNFFLNRINNRLFNTKLLFY